MKTTTMLLWVLSCCSLLSACNRDRMSEKGFHLPEGDPVAGRVAFVSMQCTQCHTISNHGHTTSDHGLATEYPSDPVYVELGGNVADVKTYGQLVTSIINPSHELAPGYREEYVSEDGDSRMYVYNSFMTVQQLIDIVAYLQPFYVDVVPNFYFITHP